MDGEEERDGDEECHHDIDGGEVGFADVQVAHREKESGDEAHGPASRDRRPEKENDEHGQGTGDGANPPADEVVQARACDGDIVQEVERPRVASPCFLHTVVGPECRGIQIKEKTRIEKLPGCQSPVAKIV